MENTEEILQCLDEFTKLRPKKIPPELDYYLSFVARTGDPVYQWPLIKCLFREKLINVITEFYGAAYPSIEIPRCPNLDLFNYEVMAGFILDKLDTFAAAPFTVQRICELLTSPSKEYRRIDKFMRALEKNILVVSTREPGSRKTENGGLETEHDKPQEINSLNLNINEEVDLDETKKTETLEIQGSYISESETKTSADRVMTSRQLNNIADTSLMIVEPSTLPPTTTTTTTAANIVLNEEEQLKQASIVTTEAETIANIPEIPEVPDCSENMETTQIICAETELITPPKTETEIISIADTADSQSQSGDKKEDEIVSSTENENVREQTETETNEVEVEVTASSNETIFEEIRSAAVAIIGPEDMQAESEPIQPIVTAPKKDETETNEVEVEVTASSNETVFEEIRSAAVAIIGPEDMQMKDISPELEPTPPIVTAPKKDETEIEKVEDVVEMEVQVENEKEDIKEEVTDEKQN